MDQKTLFNAEPKEAKPIVEEPPEVEEKNNGWNDPYNKEVMAKEREEGIAYTCLGLRSRSNLEGISYSVDVSTAYEMPRSFLGSSWGSGADFDLENPEPFFKDLMDQKLEARKEPYKNLTEEGWEVESHHESDFYRLIPMRNFIIVLGDKLKSMLKEKGFDFDKWYEEYKSIEELESTPEYEQKIEDIKNLLIKGQNITKNAKRIKESIRYKLGERERYTAKVSDCFPESGVDELLSKLKEIKNQIIEINKEIKSKGITIYREDYECFDEEEVTKVLSPF
jgi:hypothetical protein